MDKPTPWWSDWKHPILWSLMPGIPTAFIVVTGIGVDRLGTAGTWAAITAAVFGTTITYRNYSQNARNRADDLKRERTDAIVENAGKLLESIEELEGHMSATIREMKISPDESVFQHSSPAQAALDTFVNSRFAAVYLRAFASTVGTPIHQPVADLWSSVDKLRETTNEKKFPDRSDDQLDPGIDVSTARALQASRYSLQDALYAGDRIVRAMNQLTRFSTARKDIVSGIELYVSESTTGTDTHRTVTVVP